MRVLRLQLKNEEWDALEKAGKREKRYPGQQAEVILRKALGLSFPIEPEDEPKAEDAEAKRG